MRLVLEIPDSVEQALRVSDHDRQRQLLLELAVALYSRGMLPLGKASELAEMSRMEFGLVLGRRGIPRHYGEDDLEEDLRYAVGDAGKGSPPKQFKPPAGAAESSEVGLVTGVARCRPSGA